MPSSNSYTFSLIYHNIIPTLNNRKKIHFSSLSLFCSLFALVFVVFCVRLSICVLSHETLCFYQTISILFIYSAYKLQVGLLNFCVLVYRN